MTNKQSKNDSFSEILNQEIGESYNHRLEDRTTYTHPTHPPWAQKQPFPKPSPDWNRGQSSGTQGHISNKNASDGAE